ncbi:hypothetical protein R1flu_000797 [Riccia fluitans]|uniref:Uncharacterized protein n=1 Tax=Riccia fluitans TaxID=41844 RepID=A0ABD1Y1H7_9MARC
MAASKPVSTTARAESRGVLRTINVATGGSKPMSTTSRIGIHGVSVTVDNSASRSSSSDKSESSKASNSRINNLVLYRSRSKESSKSADTAASHSSSPNRKDLTSNQPLDQPINARMLLLGCSSQGVTSFINELYEGEIDLSPEAGIQSEFIDVRSSTVLIFRNNPLFQVQFL